VIPQRSSPRKGRSTSEAIRPTTSPQIDSGHPLVPSGAAHGVATVRPGLAFLVLVALLACSACRSEPASCRSSDLRLAVGSDRISPPIGQHPLPLTVTNASTRSCYLSGYPRVSLLDATGRELPFDVRHSGDQVVTSHPPTRVDLPPGSAAYVTINKYRCDRGDRGSASIVQLAPPNDATLLQATLTAAALQLGYCGPGDPGSIVSMSPIGATPAATHAR